MSILARLLLTAAAAASTTATTVVSSATAASDSSRPHPADPAAVAAAAEPRMALAFEPNPRLQAAADASTAPGSTLMTGRLLDPAGEPLPDTEVRIDLEPAPSVAAAAPAGAGVALVRLGFATSDDQGRFRVEAQPLADLHGYVDRDGSASLLITSSSARGRLLYHVSAFPPEGSAREWTWASPDPGVAAGPVSPTRATGSLSATSAPGPAGLTGLVLHTTDSPAAPAGGTAGSLAATAVAGGDYCPGVTYYWRRYDGAVIKNWSRVQRVFTKGRTKWRYNWSTTASTMVDAAANLGKAGALVSAGFVHVQRASAGVDFSFGHQVDADAAVQFDNRPYYLYCHDVPSGKTWYSGVYEWRPYKFTGGNQHMKPKNAIFRCRAAYRIKIRDPLWVARSTSYTYSGGAKLSTISVRVKQQNDAYHKLTFVPKPAPAWLCGSNDYPVYARQVKEVGAP